MTKAKTEFNGFLYTQAHKAQRDREIALTLEAAQVDCTMPNWGTFRIHHPSLGWGTYFAESKKFTSALAPGGVYTAGVEDLLALRRTS